MNMHCIFLILTFSCLLTACDQHENADPKKTHARSMIIGGMPTSDRDYKLLAEQVSVTSNAPKAINSID